MQINPVNSLGLNAPAASVSGVASAVDTNAMDRQIVAAVHSLNESEMLGQDRELTYKRDPKSGRLVVQILAKDSGNVIDQIPPETLLQLGESLSQRIKEEAAE